jgi:hypothetical protein
VRHENGNMLRRLWRWFIHNRVFVIHARELLLSCLENEGAGVALRNDDIVGDPASRLKAP